MTNEEAIKYGTEWLKDEYLDARDGAFIEIALEALKQEPYKVSEYDKDHIWYRGVQYISLRRFLEVKSEEKNEPCDKCVYSTKDGDCQYDDITETIPPFEPCGDLISRQAVQDYIAKYLSQYLYDDVREAVEVIDEYIGELPSVNLMLCEDAISREDALMCLTGEIKETDTIETIIARFVRRIRKLPPVTPQPKTGHWKAKSFHELFCDNCGFDFDIMKNDFIDKMNYCPNCGAKMIEPQGI